jgi:hypothetical protein
MIEQTIFQTIVVLLGALSTSAAALFYFRKVRLDRPAIGCFNGRDLIFLFGFIVTLPVLYLYVPPVGLTLFLVVTCCGARCCGRPSACSWGRTSSWLTTCSGRRAGGSSTGS